MPSITAKYLHIRGLVQGVGFRPFVYRLAKKHCLNGWVLNGNDGVMIYIEGLPEEVKGFLSGIRAEAPEASQISEIQTSPAEPQHLKEFVIRKSSDSSEEITEISPDIAVCAECLIDMKSQAHRIDYPFINCTNCGPRFTIIRDLPYDRHQTTMEPFLMCNQCSGEYADLLDRRFHAQPVACNHCGPQYAMDGAEGRITGTGRILDACAALIDGGGLVTIKGLGGFHLACDALNDQAVKLLRSRKNREGKPFAVMFANIGQADAFLEIGPTEAKSLQSWRRPIVILKNRQNGPLLSASVSNGFHTTGAMLPYMPFHHLLFERLKTPAIVLTSGNLSDEPILIENRQAKIVLGPVTDAVVDYDRDIFNRTDDSVVMVAAEKERLIRRSRGYVPTPVHLPLNTEGIFAAGAELVNCFAVGKGNQAILSQHIGDLKNLETLEFYSESFGRFSRMFRVKPTLIACDLHPDYLSTRFAEELSKTHSDLPILRLQHHHAHIASCMAEHGLDQPVIGISMDGVGLGTDGHIWGFEVMVADLLQFNRISHLDYVPQPGGDQATHEPWRMALSYIDKYLGPGTDLTDLPFLNPAGSEQISLIRSMLKKNLNCPLTSSAGRLFDAVAAMTGLCTHSLFHAEAPMRLEDVIDPSVRQGYEVKVSDVIDPSAMIQEIYEDVRKAGASIPVIAARFHLAMISAITNAAIRARDLSGYHNVALSGGVFQNRYLLTGALDSLEKQGFKVYTQSRFPANDGGLALGQLAIAAKRRAERSFEF